MDFSMGKSSYQSQNHKSTGTKNTAKLWWWSYCQTGFLPPWRTESSGWTYWIPTTLQQWSQGLLHHFRNQDRQGKSQCRWFRGKTHTWSDPWRLNHRMGSRKWQGSVQSINKKPLTPGASLCVGSSWSHSAEVIRWPHSSQRPWPHGEPSIKSLIDFPDHCRQSQFF